MTYTRQTWGDNNPSYPASAARFTHMEDGLVDHETRIAQGETNWAIAKVVYPSGDATGALDDAAVAAAVAALPNGGRVVLAAGHFYSASGWDGHGKLSLTFEGQGGLSGGATCATLLTYLGTGIAVNLRSTYGCRVRDIQIVAANASFTGALVDLSHDPTLATDSALWEVDRCYLGVTGTTTAGSCINLDKAIVGKVKGCNIVGAKYGIQGAATGASYSNGVKITDANRFSGQGTAQIQGPGQGWDIDGNTFEALAGGGCAAIVQNGAGQGGRVSGNWFGDVSGSGTQIQAGTGYQIDGNYIGGNQANGTIAVSLPAGVKGVGVQGNEMVSHATGISISSTATDFDVFPNYYSLVTTPVTAPTVAAGAGAGTGPTVTVTGSDQGGALVVTTGTSPAAGVLATVTFAGGKTSPRIQITPFGANTPPLSAYVSAVTTRTFALSVINSPSPSTTYEWFWEATPVI